MTIADLFGITKVQNAVDKILEIVREIKQGGITMAGELEVLKEAVASNTTVIGSAIVLLQGLKQKLDEAIASGDPAALQALSDELGAQDQALADAIKANTPE